MFPFGLKVKISVVSDTLFFLCFLSLTDSCHAKKAQVIFVFFNGSDSYQIPYSTGSRAAAGVGRYFFTCFLLLTFIVKKYLSVYNVTKFNRCSMLKIQTIREWNSSLPPSLTYSLKTTHLSQTLAILFWCVISDLFLYRLSHVKLQVFNYFWPTKMQFHMFEANRYIPE